MGNISAGIKVLRSMEQGNCQANVVAYNTIIDSLCKDRQLTEALNIFSEMITKGISPTVVTYNSIIHTL